MLRWAIIFFIIALVAAVLGFGGISGMSFEIAKFIAIIAVILFVGCFAENQGRDLGVAALFHGSTVGNRTQSRSFSVRT